MLRVGLGVAALILLALDLVPGRYVAETVILLPAPALGGAEPTTAEAEIRRLLAPALLARVADGLRLEVTGEFAAPADPLRADAALRRAAEFLGDRLGAAARAGLGWTPPATAPAGPEALRSRAAGRLGDRVSAAPLASGAGVALRVRAAEAGLAALIANTLADLYARDRLQARIEAEERAARLLANRLEELTARLAAAETAAEARRAALRAASASALAEAGRRLEAHESALDAYRTRGLGEPLAAARADEGQVRRAWQAAQARLEGMREDLDAMRAAAEVRARDDPDLLARTGEARALGALRDATRSRLQAVVGAGAGATGPERSDIRIAGPALPPAAPDRLSAATALIAALCGGLAAAGMAGAAAEATDRALRSLEDAAEEARMPALAAVPRTVAPRSAVGLAGAGLEAFSGDGGAAAGLLALARARPAGPLAEAGRALRVRLMAGATAPMVIAVTSPGPREGRSETAALLAETCARIGLRTVLVDADIRAPSQAARFGLQGAADLLETLERGAPLDEVLWTDTATGLSILPAEPAPAWRADLLAGPAMAALLGALRKRFDVVVLDTPPLLSVADGFVLAAKADRVLLLAREGRTRRESLRAAARMLTEHDIRPAGVALTDALAPTRASGLARRPSPPRDRFGRFSEGFGDG